MVTFEKYYQTRRSLWSFEDDEKVIFFPSIFSTILFAVLQFKLYRIKAFLPPWLNWTCLMIAILLSCYPFIRLGTSGCFFCCPSPSCSSWAGAFLETSSRPAPDPNTTSSMHPSTSSPGFPGIKDIKVLKALNISGLLTNCSSSFSQATLQPVLQSFQVIHFI